MDRTADLSDQVIGNLIRPFSLGIRLFGNLFADEQVLATVAGLAPPFTWFAPIALMPLSVFVALIQTFVFIRFRSFTSARSRMRHTEAHGVHEEGDEMIAAVLTLALSQRAVSDTTNASPHVAAQFE